jgi:hypothetical protein
MPIGASVDVYGAKAVLTELNKIDRTQKFKAIAKMKAAGAPLIAAGQRQYPSDPVLVSEAGNVSWSPNGRLGYSKKKADTGVQLQIGGRSKGQAYAIATLIQKNPGAAMFDIAGFANGKFSKGTSGDAFIKKLNKDFGPAQRGMWRNIKTIRDIGNQAILDAINEVAEEFNRKIVS